MKKNSELLTLIHNPRCSTSIKALKILKDRGFEPSLFLYLEEKLTQKYLKGLLKKLNIKVDELVRKKEKLYKEKYADKNYSQQEWLRILVANPRLIERPILISGDKAAIGRPPERVLRLIN